MPSVLIVEDEVAIADTLIYALKTENLSVEHVLTGQQAIDYVTNTPPSFVVLDIGLPDLTGLDVCRRIRTFSQVPILFLTARDSEIDQVLGLELGADDYVTKPFSPRAVVARIRAILRRTDANDATASRDILQHSVDAMCITCYGKALELTAHEYKLLATMLAQPNRVFTREQLLERAWDDPGAAMDRSVDAHIKAIRAKLRVHSHEAALAIQTRRGLGYTLVL